MTTQTLPATNGGTAQLMEQVLITGDLAKLSPADRLQYYRMVCESVGFNPLTRPLEYITLSGRLTLYVRKDGTDQLRRNHGVSITSLEREVIEGLYVVTATAKHGERTDLAVGAVAVEGLQGEARANAFMKAETKAKRRVTLSICGLGMLDESELQGHPDAWPADVDPTTGEVTENERAKLLKSISEYATTLKMTEKQRRELWAQKTGGERIDPRNVDVAILTDLCEELRVRVEGAKTLTGGAA